MGDYDALIAHLSPIAAKMALSEPFDVSNKDFLDQMFEVTGRRRGLINEIFFEAVRNAGYANAPYFSIDHFLAAVRPRDRAQGEAYEDIAR